MRALQTTSSIRPPSPDTSPGHAPGASSLNQGELDFTAARAARDAGMQTAVDHADRVVDGWQELALDAFRAFARAHVTFTTEQVRTGSPHVPEPPDKRAWGHVARRAVKEGLVTKIGLVQARSRTVHCMHVNLYQSKL